MGAMVSEANTSGTATGAATFTKWMVGEGPEMAGLVGGAVGQGVFAGKVLDMKMGPTTTVEAQYGFEGSERAFKALVHVEQTGLEAVISGVVIDGWGKGSPVRGAFSEIQCEHDGVTTDCWRGSLEIVGDSGG
jgi:hypothetical protein